MCCWVICNIRKYNHVSPAMRGFHGLKIYERITYKLCLLVYKCCNYLTPKYLSDLLPSRASIRSLRSSKSDTIQKAYFKTVNISDPHSVQPVLVPETNYQQESKQPNHSTVLSHYLRHTYLRFLVISDSYFILYNFTYFSYFRTIVKHSSNGLASFKVLYKFIYYYHYYHHLYTCHLFCICL